MASTPIRTGITLCDHLGRKDTTIHLQYSALHTDAACEGGGSSRLSGGSCGIRAGSFVKGCGQRPARI
jgi:hypothetical protein